MNTIQMLLLPLLTKNMWFPQSTLFENDEATSDQMVNSYTKTTQ